VFALLAMLAGGIGLLGIFFAPAMVDVVAFGFEGERRRLAVEATRVIFPMTGILVLSAWALGILNSHRRFFLAYVAPVLWNAAMIATMVLFGRRLSPANLVMAVSWGALVGGALQFLVQLPRVLRLEPNLRLSWATLRGPLVATIVANALPVLLGRGVVQLSAYVDVMLASKLSVGALSAMTYAMTLYLLPISLFGMSVAAAELPELSRQRGQAAEVLRARVNAGLRQIAVFVVPSTVGYLALGDVVVATVLQTGKFSAGDTIWVWIVLGGFTLGLMASTGTRLFSSTYYALHDTKTPAWVAFLRVILTAALGYALMIPLERHLIVAGHRLGALGLTLGAGFAAWVEWGLLRRGLRRRIGPVGAGLGTLGRMFAAALVAAAVARGIAYVVPAPEHLLPGAASAGSAVVRLLFRLGRGAVVLGPFGAVYFLLAAAFGVTEAEGVVGRVVARIRRRSA
ncbi:MAG: murein biosynthesis integral membrane protein MurJ, partial [Gemmatimonadetes bacterium]|nr:murein biosynthesis integral membrane protein MurJ [Gemmatimonadota bacterium]